MLLLHFSAIFLSFLTLASAAGEYLNPIKDPNGSDPWMTYQDGYYYLMTTTWTNLQITRATTVGGLKTATPKVVWTDSTASRCCNVWAPEIHWMASEGAWYIYYAAGSSSTLDDQRIYALKSSSTDIWASTWSYAGRIVIPNRDVWAIDPTILVLSSGNYLVFSSWDGDYQCLWIAEMTSATTIGDAYEISCPTLSWEQVGGNTNEGPAALYFGGATYLMYSASSCATSSYSLGRLTLTGSNPLSESSWTKYTPGPVFQSANGQYGTGHNYFFLSPSGEQFWNVYHFSPSSDVACDGTRETAIQIVTTHSDGTPNLGSPSALTAEIPEPV